MSRFHRVPIWLDAPLSGDIIPKRGEIVVNPDTRLLYVGDGVSAISALASYASALPYLVLPAGSTVADIPYATPQGTAVIIPTSAAAPVLFRKNLALDPMATDTANFAQLSGALTLITDWYGSAVRWTRTATGQARVNIRRPGLTPLATYSFRVSLRSSVEFSGSTTYRPAQTNNSTGEVVFQKAVIHPAGESVIRAENVALSATATSPNGSFCVFINDGPIGQTVDFTRIQIEAGPTVGDFFYGDTTDAAPYSYNWVGTPNASDSEAWRTPFQTDLYIA